MEESRERPLIAAPRCPYCHEDVERGQALSVCADCHAFHHLACHRELRGCAACGRARAPVAPSAAQAHVTRAGVEARGRARARKRALLAFGLLLVLAFAGAARAGWQARERGRSPVAAVERFEELSRRNDSSGWDHATNFRASLSRELRRVAGPAPDEDDASWAGVAAEEAGVHRDELGRECHDVRKGARLHHLVLESGQWLVERLLARDETPVPGARLRLPLGLAPADARNGYRAGDLVGTLRRELFAAPLEDALLRREVRGPCGSLLRRDATCARLGELPVALYVGGDGLESVAVAYVELEPGEPLRYELRAPPHHESFLGALLRASLATLRPTTPGPTSEAVARRALERVVLDEGLAIRTPGGAVPGQSLNGERVEVSFHVGGENREPLTREALATNARQQEGELLAEYEVAGTLLPWRSIWKTTERGKEKLVVVATGIVDSGGAREGVIVTASGPFERGAWRAERARLDEIASSLERLRDEEQWPERLSAFDGWSTAGVRLPSRWKVASSESGLLELEGFRGDRIEVELVAAQEGGFHFEPAHVVRTVRLEDGTRVRVSVQARDEERLRNVHELADRIANTLHARSEPTAR